MSIKISKHYEKNNSNKKGKSFEELFGEERAFEMRNQISEVASKRIGEKNSFYGKKHSDESKKKISYSRKGILPGNTRKVVIENVEYESATEAGRVLGVVTATITHRIKSPNKNYANYFYKDEIKNK
jgi:hypothetical protein